MTDIKKIIEELHSSKRYDWDNYFAELVEKRLDKALVSYYSDLKFLLHTMEDRNVKNPLRLSRKLTKGDSNATR